MTLRLGVVFLRSVHFIPCLRDTQRVGRKWHRAASGFAAPRLAGRRRGVGPLLTGVSLSLSLGTAAARAGRSLGKPSPRSAAALRQAAPGSRCPPAGAVTTRQAAASCRAKLRGGAARERQHAARGLGKPAPP